MFLQRFRQVPDCFRWKKPAQKASKVEQEMLCVTSLEGARKISANNGKIWDVFLGLVEGNALETEECRKVIRKIIAR